MGPPYWILGTSGKAWAIGGSHGCGQPVEQYRHPSHHGNVATAQGKSAVGGSFRSVMSDSPRSVIANRIGWVKRSATHHSIERASLQFSRPIEPATPLRCRPSLKLLWSTAGVAIFEVTSWVWCLSRTPLNRAANSAARVPSSHGGSHRFESCAAQYKSNNSKDLRRRVRGYESGLRWGYDSFRPLFRSVPCHD